MKNKEKTILQACGYAAPYPGNFVAAQCKLAENNRYLGYRTIFAFPETAKEKEWCKELEKKYDVYYLPLNKARVRYKTYSTVKQIFKENNIVIAHSHFELYDMPVSLMALRNTKIFWHLHDALDLIYKKSNFIYKILWKIQYALFSRKVTLLSVSENAKNFAIKLGFRRDRAFFVPNGIDTDRISLTQDKNLQQYDFLLFGWDYYRKGVDILINAVKRMITEKFTCVIIAEDPPKKLYNNINNYPQLIYHAPVQDAASLYNASKCFLHISRYEGLSYALLEAIYAGCIVICSDIEQNMFAKKFKNVYFVPVGDSDALAKAMRMVLNEQIKISEEEIDFARALIQSEYSLASWEKRIQKFYFR